MKVPQSEELCAILAKVGATQPKRLYQPDSGAAVAASWRMPQAAAAKLDFRARDRDENGKFLQKKQSEQLKFEASGSDYAKDIEWFRNLILKTIVILARDNVVGGYIDDDGQIPTVRLGQILLPIPRIVS